MTKDQPGKLSSSITQDLLGKTFSESEYSVDAGRIIAYAAATGSAVVAAVDGRPRVIISIPVVDLPTLGD